MQKKIILASVSILSFFFIILGYLYFSVWRYTESTDNAYVQSDVTVISSKITGYAQEILIKDNQAVSKDEVLIQIKPLEYNAKLQQAQAAIQLVESNIATLDTKLDLQESLIDEAEATLESANAELYRAEKDYKRSLNLTSDDIISQKKFEESDASYKKASANFKKANASLRGARQQIPILKNERLENQAKLSQAMADYQIAQDNFNNTNITSPITGRVGNKIVQIGQLVRPGQQLLSIVPYDTYIYANFKETQVQSMVKGQKVEIKVDAYPNQKFQGYIDSLSPASGSVFSLLPPENATGNFTKIVQRIPVKISFVSPEDSHKMRPGMSAVIKVYTRESIK